MASKIQNIFRSKKSKSPQPNNEPLQESSSHTIPPDQPAEPSLIATNAAPTTGEIESSSANLREGSNYGVKELYNGGANATIDIVFVHGLTGNSYTTWLHKDSRVHWPRDLLKQDIADSRILAFGYDADVVKLWNPASTGRLSNHAENMVGAIVRRRERTGTEKRRIMFVAHSLGGLLVEKALNHSRGAIEKALRQIEQYTAGVVFLGVPHCGADLAGWASTATRMINVIRHADGAIVEVLKPGSEILREVEKDFRSILILRKDEGSEIFVTCFFEELPVLGVGEIVPLHSAELKPYGCYGIHANHMDMTKFADREDPGYDAILGELLRWKRFTYHRISEDKRSMDMTSDTGVDRYQHHFGDTRALNSQIFQGTFHNTNVS